MTFKVLTYPLIQKRWSLQLTKSSRREKGGAYCEDVNLILAVPGFWVHMVPQPLPKNVFFCQLKG